MSLSDMLSTEEGSNGGVKGVAIAVVTNNQDDEKLGRVKVKYPWRDAQDETDWARCLTFMAGNEMGGFFLPDVNDEVLVAFENGDIDHPLILGSLWSGAIKPPEVNADGKNNLRFIKSRSGHKILLDDSNGAEKILIVDKSEKNMITIDTQSNTISITSEKDIEIKAPNGKITLEATEFDFKSKAAAKIEAGANMDLKATGNNTIKGAMVMIN